jgi:Ni,Fe-hydrogenase I small subunit
MTLIEGAVGNEEQLNLLKLARTRSKIIVSLGDCAVTGNVTALRNGFSDNVEGLRSPKAIAFINNSLRTENYYALRKSPQQATIFSEKEIRVENRLSVWFRKNSGEKKWMK